MPYKLQGSSVMVKRGGRWVLLKKHKTRTQAAAHLRALKANVKE